MKTEEGSEALHPWIEPELEARLTALVLGEVSDFERDALERLAAERPELALYRKRLEAMHRLLREVAGGDSAEEQGEWRLAPARREALLAKLGAGAAPIGEETMIAGPGARRRPPWGLALRIAACIAVIALVLGLSVPVSSLFLKRAASEPAGAGGHYAYTEAAKSPALHDEYFDSLSFTESETVRPLAERAAERAAGDPAFGRRGRFNEAPHERQDDPAPAPQVGGARTSGAGAPADGSLPGIIAFGAGGDVLIAGREEARRGPAPAGPQGVVQSGTGTASPTATKTPASLAMPTSAATAAPAAGTTPLAVVDGDLDGIERLSRFKADAMPEAKAEGEPVADAQRNLSLERLRQEGAPPSTEPMPAAAAKPAPAPTTREAFGNLAAAGKAVGLNVAPAHPAQANEAIPADAPLSDPGEKAMDASLAERSSAVAIGDGFQGKGAADAKGTSLMTQSRNGVEAAESRDQSILRTLDASVGGFETPPGQPSGAASTRDQVLRRERLMEPNAAAPGSGGAIAVGDGKSQIVAFDGALSVDGSKGAQESGGRFGAMGPSSAGAKAREIDPSLREILELTPQVGQAKGDDFDRPGRVAGSGGRIEDSRIAVPEARDPQAARPGQSGAIATAGEAVLKELETANRPGLPRVSKFADDFSLQAESLPSTLGRQVTPVESDFATLATAPAEAAVAAATTVRRPLLRQAIPPALEETSPGVEPFSTFSLHVSDVSFQLAKAALAAGQWPEPDKIRLEEFVNAFDYGDPMPARGERVACRIDQAGHPFLQQRHLVRIALRTAEAGRSAGTPLRLTLLLDSSGSMERPDRRETVRRAVSTLAGLLGEQDRITLVTFARQPRLLADGVPGTEAGKLAETVAALPSEGGTNLEAALQLAFEKAREHREDNAQNRIVLLTDGAANLGDAKAESLATLVEGMRDAGIAFDAAGFGAEGLNDEILEALTRKGDGRYYLLDRPEDAEDAFARQIAGALRPAAKNVKVQVEFHPGRVKSYKLLGFEKHRLATEDFRNDAVDAAELAAAEAGVAVYQVEPDPAGEGDLGAVSVRFRDLDSGAMVERRWVLPYLAAAPAADQGGEAIRLATVASQFAAKLAGGPLGDVVDLGELARLAATLPDSPRVGELRTLIEQARAIEGSR